MNIFSFLNPRASASVKATTVRVVRVNATTTLRAEPSSTSTSRGTAAAGTDALVTGREGGTWTEVYYKSATGWLPTTLLTTISPQKEHENFGYVAPSADTVLRDQPHDKSPVTQIVPENDLLWMTGRSHDGWLAVSHGITHGWLQTKLAVPATHPSWRGARTLSLGQALLTEPQGSANTMVALSAGEDLYATGRVWGLWAEVVRESQTGWVSRTELAALSLDSDAFRIGPATATASTVLRVQAHVSSDVRISVPINGELWLSGRFYKEWAEVYHQDVGGWISEQLVAPRSSSSWMGVRTLKVDQILHTGHQSTATALATLRAGEDVFATGIQFGTRAQVIDGSRSGWVDRTQLAYMQTVADRAQVGWAKVAGATILRTHPHKAAAVSTDVSTDGSIWLSGKRYKEWVFVSHNDIPGWMLEQMLAPEETPAWSGVRSLTSLQPLRDSYSSTALIRATLSADQDVVLTGHSVGQWTQVFHESTIGWVPQAHLAVLDLADGPEGLTTSSGALTLLAYPVSGAAHVASVSARASLLATGRYHKDYAELVYGTQIGWGLKSRIGMRKLTPSLPVVSPLIPGMTGTNTTMEELVARRFCIATSPTIYTNIRGLGWNTWLSHQMWSNGDADSAFTKLLTDRLPLAAKTYSETLDYLAAKDVAWNDADISRGVTQRVGVQLLRQLFTNQNVLETLFELWMDHFSIPYTPGLWATIYTIDVEMRKVALSTFPQVLRTMYRNLAIYSALDNTQNRKDAFNENLSRETLELYTLGAGHFTEVDVEQFTILLTGWGSSEDGRYRLQFRPYWHQFTASPLKIVGESYPNATEAQARESLNRIFEDLAYHPATQRMVSHKLVKRFVGEDAPRSLVDRLVSVYQSTGGDIKEMIWQIVNSAAFRGSAGSRWKRPGEYAQSIHRAMQVDWDHTRTPRDHGVFSSTLNSYLHYLSVAGHRPRSWGGPDGYPDANYHWMSSSSILQCIKLASDGKPVDRELAAAGTWAEVLQVDQSFSPQTNALSLCRALTGYTPNAAIRRAVVEALLTPQAAWPERVDAAVRVILTSPLAFLR